jgi:hypothetical protein
MNERPGCLSGLLKLFLVDAAFDFFQKKFGFGRGGCCGCGCGVILLIVSTILSCSILFGTDWLKFGF